MLRVLESLLVSFRNPGTLPKQGEVNTLRLACRDIDWLQSWQLEAIGWKSSGC